MFAIASAPRLPGYQAARIAPTCCAHGVRTEPPVWSTTTVRGLARGHLANEVVLCRPAATGSAGPFLPRVACHANTIATSAEAARRRRRIHVFARGELDLRRWRHRRDRLQRRRVMPTACSRTWQAPSGVPGGVSSSVTPPIASTRDDPPPDSTPMSARRPITAIFFRSSARSGSRPSRFSKQDDAAFRDSLGDGEARRRVDLAARSRRGRARRPRQDCAGCDAPCRRCAFRKPRLFRPPTSMRPRSSVPPRTPGRSLAFADARRAVRRAPVGHDPALEAPLGLSGCR